MIHVATSSPDALQPMSKSTFAVDLPPSPNTSLEVYSGKVQETEGRGLPLDALKKAETSLQTTAQDEDTSAAVSTPCDDNDVAIHTIPEDSASQDLWMATPKPNEGNSITSIPFRQTCVERSSGAELTKSYGSGRRKKESYWKFIERLAVHLPHLQNLRSRSRHHHMTVKSLDYVDGSLMPTKSYTHKSDSNTIKPTDKASLQRALTDGITDKVQCRLIMVEDLSTEVIEILDSAFGISPEVFEEHLLNSGWRNGLYQDEEADMWNTHNMEKNYASVRWYRPIKHSLERPFSATEFNSLLGSSMSQLRRTEEVQSFTPNTRDMQKHRRVIHKYTTTTNILRRYWSLKTNPRGKSLRGNPGLWEERATVCSKKLGNCQISGFSNCKTLTCKLTIDP